MKVSDVMARDPTLIDPSDTLQHAAKMMRECDCGVLPAGEGDRLVGMITDRDIAIRRYGRGQGPSPQGPRGNDPRGQIFL
jgi:CBS domain-containing protein